MTDSTSSSSESSPPSSSSSPSPSSSFDSTLSAIKELCEHIAPLYNTDHELLLNEKLDINDSINLNLSLSYTLASVFYCYLSANGQGTENHPIKDDLHKIRDRIERYKRLKSLNQEKEGSKPELRVDQRAALRIVSKELVVKQVRSTNIEGDKSGQKKRKVASQHV